MSLSKRSGPETPGIAFVTGGARGLGNAIAVSFAREGAKAVVIVDIGDMETGRKMVEACGTECLAINADVTKEEDIERAIAETVAKYGRIDYTANFAGIVGSSTLMSDTTAEDFLKCLDVNTLGVFLCTKHQIKQMMKQETIQVEEGRPIQRGSIVNCASVNSIMAAQTVGPYTASKHAVMGITKVAALEARGHGIRVNAVSPGFLFTKMVSGGQDVLSGTDKAEALRVWEACLARQGRQASFDEIGDAVVLLSTPKMSLVNGHNLVCDYGFTINEALT